MHSVTQFGKYILDKELATGGMAEVFLARPRADFATVAFEEWSGEVGAQGR